MSKESASNFLQKAKTGILRANQKVMTKLGKAEETVDINFNQEKERFFEHYKAIKVLNEDIVKMVKIMKEVAVIQNKMAEDFYEMFDTGSDMYNVGLKNQDVAKFLDNARIQLEEQLRVDFIEPLSKYQGQFKEMKDRIELRGTRRVDMDRYASSVKKAQEKYDKAKLETSEAKYAAAKINYESLNSELLQDLPKLFEDRLTFFSPAFATYLTAWAEYYRQGAKTTQEIISMVSHIDRQSIHTLPRVTTDTANSSASKKETAYNVAKEKEANRPPSSEYSPASSPPLGSAPPPSAPKAVQAKALFDFNAQDSSELPFRAGDIITIRAQNGEWWEGELNGRRGLLPSNYVQLI